MRDVSLVRSVVEELSASESYHTPLLVEAYGVHIFKCPILACSRFQHGFKTRKMRDEHQDSHRRRFQCTYKGCDYLILGFSAHRELAKHLLVHAATPDEITFPKVRCCSLKKSLEDAIDEDDATSVAALCAEVLAISDRKTGFLSRAVWKGSFNAARAIMETLGTEAEIGRKDGSRRSSIHYDAETGDEELQKWLLEVGADLKAQGSTGETALTNVFHRPVCDSDVLINLI